MYDSFVCALLVFVNESFLQIRGKPWNLYLWLQLVKDQSFFSYDQIMLQ